MYVFDLAAGRAVISLSGTDGKTGSLPQFIAHLHAKGYASLLRHFALRCARVLEAEAPSSAGRLLGVVEDVLWGEAPEVDLERIRRELRGTASAATAIGMRRGAPNAAAFMAAYAAADPEPERAASESAHMQRLHASLRARREGSSPAAVDEVTEEKQLDLLLEMYAAVGA